MSVTLSGGEPFFRGDLKEIIDGIVSNRMRFNILSNGTMISDSMSAFLRSTGRCNGVQVSIDGSTPITHDSFRGKGNFYKTIQGIESLRNNEVPVSVRVTIHKRNVRDLEGIARLLLEDIGIPAFSTNSASFMGLCRRNSEQVQLTVEERSLAMETLIRLKKRYKGRINASAGPLAEAVDWQRMEQACLDNKEIQPGRGFLAGCGGPITKLAVRADGVMVPCIQLSHIELGRINKDDLKDVWQNNIELKRIRERVRIPLSEFEFCQGCDYIKYCTGSCPASAYTILGQENHPSPESCLRLFLEAGGKLPPKDIGIRNG
jgi:SynChlorMet cassette radical SAM/SPASM protein ScmE